MLYFVKRITTRFLRKIIYLIIAGLVASALLSSCSNETSDDGRCSTTTSECS